MASEAPALGPIMQILVPVADVDQAATLYADVLALLMREAPKGLERG